MTPAATPRIFRASFVDVLAIVWAVLVSAALFAVFRRHGFDDPFITYRYATNLAAGAGFVYNPGERVLSTTAPLYALLLAPAAALGLDLPTVSNLVGAASLGFGGLAFWRLGRLAAMPVAGAFALLVYPLLPQLVLTLGAETALLIALTLWGFVAVAAGRPVRAGLFLAAATLVRADGALAAVVAGCILLAQQPRSGQQRSTAFSLQPSAFSLFCASYLLAVAPFAIAAWLYFGSPLPATLGAKRSQALIPGSRSYFAGLLALLAGLATRPLLWPLLALAPPGILKALRRPASGVHPSSFILHPSSFTLPLAWGALHAAAYSLIGITAYFWYYGPALVGLVAAAALGAEAVAELLRPRAARWAGPALAGSLALLVVAGQVNSLAYLAQSPDPRLALYRAAGDWLRQRTPPGSRVASLEVGVIGFYAERPIVDFAGLIQPDVNTVFRDGGGYERAARWAIETYRPDYIVNQEQSLPLVSGDPALAQRCSRAAALADPRHPTPLAIYHCAWPER